MTNDYKEQLLNYVTNMINKTPSNDDEIFAEEQNISRSKWSSFLPENWNDFRFEGMVAANELTSNLSVLYGGYVDIDDNTHGIIILVDENFEPVKKIDNYSSGSELRYIQYMKQAEDGTFYYIDDEAFSYVHSQIELTSQKRFVMTNNFTIPNQINGEYEIILRKSYIFGNDYRNFYCKNMFKDPNSSHYIFFGNGVDSTSPNYSYRLLKIIGLKVNVGEENEWTKYADMSNRLFGSAMAIFNNNSDVHFRCLSSSTLSTSRTINCISKTYTGNVQTNSIHTFLYHPYIDDDSYKKQSCFLDIDKVYYVQNNQHWGSTGIPNAKYIGLYSYNFTTNTYKTIYEKSLGSYDYCNIEAIYIDRCNTDIYVEYNTNINNDNNTSDYYIQRLVNDKWEPKFIGNYYFRYFQRTLFIKTNFDLLQIHLFATNPRIATWFQYLIKENYNVLNYNGIPYIDYNSLISKQGTIYSNNKLVFARNLYNKTILNNMTVSTVQIPNNYLNNIDLSPKELLGETNLNLVKDENIITKNIYETVFLNYINTINVIDEDTNTSFINVASYVNTNINTGTETNYNNTKCSKFRINYEDETTSISTLEWLPINKYNKTTQITFYVDKNIKSIDLISEDETTVYLNIPVEVEIGNTYTIKQKVRTGNKPTPVQLQYNNENINYNNEPVMVYTEEE